MKVYFHELSDAEYEQAIKDKKMYSDFLPPDWCLLYNALTSDTACAHLLNRRIKSIEDCEACQLCKKRRKILKLDRIVIENKLDRIAFEWIKKHQKATLEEAFKAGCLRHVEAWVKNER